MPLVPARLAQWLARGSGPLATSGCDFGGFVRTRDALAQHLYQAAFDAVVRAVNVVVFRRHREVGYVDAYKQRAHGFVHCRSMGVVGVRSLKLDVTRLIKCRHPLSRSKHFYLGPFIYLEHLKFPEESHQSAMTCSAS